MTEAVRERLKETGALLLDPVQLDAAVMGCWQTEEGHTVALYDYFSLIEAVRNSFDEPDSEESLFEAEEWVNFNTLRALPYMGPKAPWIVVEVRDCEEEEEEDLYIEFEGVRWRKC